MGTSRRTMPVEFRTIAAMGKADADLPAMIVQVGERSARYQTRGGGGARYPESA
jgi:hypothetical protein